LVTARVDSTHGLREKRGGPVKLVLSHHSESNRYVETLNENHGSMDFSKVVLYLAGIPHFALALLALIAELAEASISACACNHSMVR